MQLSKFVNSTSIDAKLVRAVVRQFGDWEAFKSSAPDVASHGIDGGYGGFIYYGETVPFFQKNRKLILALAKQQADDMGTGLLEMVANFNCFKGDYTIDEIGETLFGGDCNDQIANGLAWYAGEEVCRAYADSLEAE